MGTSLKNTLQPSEQFLWQGKPDTRAFLLRGWWAIPFSLLWGGFAIFWEASVLKTSAPLLFRLWGIPFVLMGLYLIVGRFFVAAREAENTIYAVTDKRILIESGVFRRTFTELDLARLPYIQLSGQFGNVGTITFGQQNYFGSFVIAGWPGTNTQNIPAFQSIPAVRDVYEIIKRAQAAR